MTDSKKDKILKEVAREAHNRRGELIQKFKEYEGRKFGNVSISLCHGFEYIYGKTVTEPQIMFPHGQQICDMDLFAKLDWNF